MKNYQEEQYKLFEKLEAQFKKNRNAAEIVEPVSDYFQDDRISLTSVAFAPNKIVEAIQDKIVDPLRKVDDRQYFYLPESSSFFYHHIHIFKKKL